MIDIQSNIITIEKRISAAASRSNRSRNDIALIAVSKTQPAEAVVSAFRLGLRHFGENRVEEAQDKICRVAEILSASGEHEVPTWHMVGHIQSRKSDQAEELFDVIHSVDSIKLARRLGKRAEASDKVVPILLELNVSGENTKYGFRADGSLDNIDQWHQLRDWVTEILGIPGIDIQGLMTMAPIVENPESTRPVFTKLRRVRDRLAAEFPSMSLHHLSMGMTDDFEVAIEEGATMVRIGRAIFGPRRH